MEEERGRPRWSVERRADLRTEADACSPASLSRVLIYLREDDVFTLRAQACVSSDGRKLQQRPVG